MNTGFPSLVLFGPLTSTRPTTARLDDIRKFLRSYPCANPIIEALEHLETAWESLRRSSPSFEATDGSIASDFLKSRLTGAGSDHEPSPQQCESNAIILPLNVITSVLQYLSFCQDRKASHGELARAARQGGGFQGCCAGLLAALAVANAETEDEIGVLAGRMVQLAFAVGAWVDADRGRKRRSGLDSTTLAIRWNSPTSVETLQTLLERYNGSYLAVVRDEHSATVVVPCRSRNDLMKTLAAQCVDALDTGLSGRYHAADNAAAVDEILRGVSPGIPIASGGSVRSNATSEPFSDHDATRAALLCILAERAEWHSTVSKASSSMDRIPGAYMLAIGADSVPFNIGKKRQTVTRNTNDILSTSHLRECDRYPEHAVAVVGMACKFPGADSPDDFWELLTQGRSMLGQMPKERFDPDIRHERATGDMKFWGNFLDDVESFDHKFFRKSSREAKSMDPQQRILLQVAYEALQSAGYFSNRPANRRESSIGCYIGACSTDYDSNIACHPPSAYATTGTLRAFLSGKISHHFGLLGPSLTFDTACSSSAVAIHAACQALQLGEVSSAVAGGATINSSPYLYENLAAAHFLSPTGATKPFDAAADGYCRGEGVGLVVLKRMTDAVEQGDHIHGVIVSSAVNQNSSCVPITVPHSQSQALLYKAAAVKGGLCPSDVAFVEAHGTGTPVGDPIELESIRGVFAAERRTKPLYVSSVKGSIGHLEAASGIAALIKALLQIRHRVVPQQASFRTLNPAIPALDAEKIVIPTRNITLANEGRLTACVNNYGAAGSNATLMLAEAPTPPPQDHDHGTMETFPIRLTAASTASLEDYCKKLFVWLQKPMNSDVRLRDVAFSLSRQSNPELAYELTLKVSSMQDLRQQVSNAAQIEARILPRPQTQPVVLCFGGQVGDRVLLDRAIWETPSALRFHLDQCDATLQAQGFPSIYPAIFQDRPMGDVVLLHSALFSLQYATAMAWIDCGLQVDAVVGHSFGQLTALAVCRSISLSDAVRLIAGRAALIKEQWGGQRGVMFAIEGTQTALQEVMERTQSDEVEIACCNGPSSHVAVACSETSAAALETRLTAASMRYKRLDVPYAFHSSLTEPLLPDLLRLADSVKYGKPCIPLEPCLDVESTEGAWAPPSPEDIVHHTRKPVHFGRAVQRVRERLGSSSCVWLEAGSGSGVTAMVRRALPPPSDAAAAAKADDHDHDHFLSSHIGQHACKNVVDTTTTLWRLGLSVDFWFYHRLAGDFHRALAVPTYAWDKSRHWLPLRLPAHDDDGDKGFKAVEEKETPPALLTLLPGHDGEHRFAISTQNEEYAALVGGFDHDSPLAAPTTLLLQILFRSLPLLEIDPNNLSFRDVVINDTGAGLRKDANVLLRLTPCTAGWKFVFTASDKLAEWDCCWGVMESVLEQRDAALADFARYQRLVGLNVARHIASHNESDCLRGKFVYNMFSKFGEYPSHYQAVQSVAAHESKIAGRVMRVNSVERHHDVHMLECFLQVAAIHANCLQRRDSLLSWLKLRSIERLQWAPSTGSESPEWDVICISDATQDGGDSRTYDIFVYNVTTGNLGVLILGVIFSDTVLDVVRPVVQPPAVGTTDILAAPSSTAPLNNVALRNETLELQVQESAGDRSVATGESDKKMSIYMDFCDLLEKIAEIPARDIIGTATFDSLGVDSLMMMEVIRDVSQLFSVELPVGDLEQLTDVDSLVAYLESRGCVGSMYDPKASTSRPQHQRTAEAAAAPSHRSESTRSSMVSSPTGTPSSATSVAGAAEEGKESLGVGNSTMQDAAQIFDDMRRDAQQYIQETGFAGFWSHVYPAQRQLVLSYTIECFSKLGCDLAQIAAGQSLPKLQVLAKYDRLVERLHEILEDSGLVELQQSEDSCLTFTRSTKPLSTPASGVLLHHFLNKFPQHKSEISLLSVTASRLAECMTGDENPLTLLFANPANRQILADVYDTAPMCLATTRLLAEFALRMLQSFRHGASTRKARILEIGAGTGGTARHVVEFLTEHGIDFEYCFTDISSALVSQAKKKFARHPQMRFAVIDCEKPVPDEFRNQFDMVIATNCVHATDSAPTTATNILPTLKKHGVFCLVEFTRSLYWFDLVYGLLDGWWLFSDGRKHALADELFWHASLTSAGFQHVSWTDGESMEARTMRLILASKQPHPNLSALPVPTAVKRAGIPMQEVAWLNRGGVELCADIYLPKAANPAHQKRPVALMFHGGGHLLFGRKDIPMKHVRELLKRGFLPVSVDYRLCPEVGLYEGPYSDCCEALRWAREVLPHVALADASIAIDQDRLISIGWSSGGQLAMSVGYTAIQRGIKPPNAVFALYTPSDLEHDHWNTPCFPNAAEEDAQEVSDFLAGVQDHQIVEYAPHTELRTPKLSLTLADDRARIVLHMNWKAQSVPTLIHGLPSRSQLLKLGESISDEERWKYPPSPTPEQIRQVSPLWHIRNGSYKVPTFMVHGNRDDWIPETMSITAKEELVQRGVPAELIIPDQCGHAFDLFPAEDPQGVGWKAVEQGYDWICSIIKM